MKNVTLALAIALGFCATEAGAQARGIGRRALLVQQQQAAEFEALILSGDAEQKLKQFEEEASKSRAALDKMLALEEKSKTLSADALAIYKGRIDVLKREYETCSNRLARAQAMLTPEKVTELRKRKKAEEEEKARKQKAEVEYKAFAADVEKEIAAEEKAQREKEREEQRAQLLKIQEELRKARAAEKSNEEK